MSKVLVGGISPEGEHILNQYLQRFLPDAVIEPIKSVGIKGTMRNKATRSDVILVILDDSLWTACKGTVDDVLKLPKVHQYLNDDGLTQFLISRFGKLDEEMVTPTGASENFTSSYSQVGGEVEESIIVGEQETDTSAFEEKISDLQDKLAKSEFLVKTLRTELENTKSESDITPFIEKIKVLEQSLADKEAELQQHDSASFATSEKLTKAEGALAEVEALKSELKQVKENCSDLEFQKQKVESEKSDLQAQYDKLTSEVEDLKQANENIEQLTNSLAEMTERCATLESMSSDANVLQQKLDETKAVYSDLEAVKKQLNEKDLEVQNIQVDLDAKSKKVEDLKGKISEANALLDEKEEELKKKQEELDAILAEKASIIEEQKSQVESLYQQINTLQAEIMNLKETVEKKSLRIAELEKDSNDSQYELSKLQEDVDKLSVKDSEISSLNTTIDEYKRMIDSLQGTINGLNEDIASKEGMIDAYKRQSEMTQDNMGKTNEALQQSLDENTRLSEQLKQVQTEKEELEGTVEGLRSAVETVKASSQNFVDTKNAEIDELNTTNKKLENELVTLRANLVEAKADSETINQLNSDLLEEKRKNARISSELEVLRAGSNILGGSDTVEINRLKKEVETLKDELEQARSNTSVSAVSDDDIQELRQKCAEMEMEMVDKDAIIDEYQNGIFGKLANVALPKVAYDIKVLLPEKIQSKCVVVASGSLESNLALYQNLKRTCGTVNNKSYIIVDLVTDTSIDSAFGIRQISSPIPWLTGTQPYTAFLADTKLPNVKVLSTGLAYINDLSFLSVDWENRIDELQNQADVVIFNVGCLNNFVAKILFGSFTKIMQGHIILKATPVNLRTIILTLTGYKDQAALSNVLVSCVNFDTSSSKPLYQKLVSKCQAQILKDADILRL